jgi:hypothetical protein
MSIWTRIKEGLGISKRDITDDREVDRGSYFASWGDGWFSPVFNFSGVNLDETIQAATWSYAAIDGNSRTMSSLEPVVQVRRRGTWTKAPPNHPLWDFLADPLGPDPIYPFWSWGRLMHLTFLHRYAAGNCYWKPQVVGFEDNRRIYSVIPLLSPGSMTVTEHPTRKTVERWNYLGAVYDPDELVNINVPSADSYWKGASPLRAALMPISTDNYAANRQDASLRNRVGLGPIIGINGPLGPSKEQEQEMYDRLITNYQSAKQEGLPFIIGGDIEVTEGPKASDLQLFDTRRYCRDQMLAVLGMPPPVAGVYDNAVYSNFKQANLIWWTHYLFPTLNDTYRAINAQLVSQVYDADTRIWYDLTGSDIAHQLFDQRVDTALNLSKLGYSTNDVNDRLDLGMPERGYLDLPNTQLVQAGRISLEQVVKMINGDLEDIVDDEPEPVVEPEPEPEDETAEGDDDEQE